MTIKEALEHLDAARIEWNEGYVYQKPRFEALDMAIEALKAQEPRVMTLPEALKADYVYLEIRKQPERACDCCILAVDRDSGIFALKRGFGAALMVRNTAKPGTAGRSSRAMRRGELHRGTILDLPADA